ncbi:MAG: aldehyde dehydrogenase family protein, partial [Pseudomonadota bacterium]|nr:aldehyde dehydrogenase family protein [Pseudomonadota bacterium]
YGLSASVWSETIGLALDIAPKLVAGVVWINATNLLDAAVGFGGTRESGFGREGGREGCLEYLKPKAWSGLELRAATPAVAAAATASAGFGLPTIDRTAKQFIGGKQVRNDSGHSTVVRTAQGAPAGEVGAGNRKDIRNAVAAARGAEGWSQATSHLRAQVLYYLAENLSARATEFAERLATLTGVTPEGARAEVEASISRLFVYAAWADKYEGRVHQPPLRGVVLAIPEPLGVVGVICPPEAPLLAFVSLIAPLISLGNRVVVVPSERTPLLATDFYQVIETSDVPGGVVNIVTGTSEGLARTLADHDDVDGLWAFGSAELSAMVEKQSAGNLKRTLVDHGRAIDWSVASAAKGPLFLRHATQVKNVWIPYGD